MYCIVRSRHKIVGLCLCIPVFDSVCNHVTCTAMTPVYAFVRLLPSVCMLCMLVLIFLSLLMLFAFSICLCIIILMPLPGESLGSAQRPELLHPSWYPNHRFFKN